MAFSQPGVTRGSTIRRIPRRRDGPHLSVHVATSFALRRNASPSAPAAASCAQTRAAATASCRTWTASSWRPTLRRTRRARPARCALFLCSGVGAKGWRGRERAARRGHPTSHVRVRARAATERPRPEPHPTSRIRACAARRILPPTSESVPPSAPPCIHHHLARRVRSPDARTSLLALCAHTHARHLAWTQLNLDNALMRHEFLEAVVRVAIAKVSRAGGRSCRENVSAAAEPFHSGLAPPPKQLCVMEAV